MNQDFYENCQMTEYSKHILVLWLDITHAQIHISVFSDP